MTVYENIAITVYCETTPMAPHDLWEVGDVIFFHEAITPFSMMREFDEISVWLLMSFPSAY